MIKGPESIVIDEDGSIYTGLSNGIIIRIDPDGTIEKIIQIGKELCGKLLLF